MNQRFPIRFKLAVALLIPVLATFAVSVFEVGQASRERTHIGQDTDLASAAIGPKSLIRKLQDERNDSAVSAVGLRSSAELPTKSLAETRASVDQAAREFRRVLARSGPKAERVYAPALAAFEKAKTRLRQTYDAAGGTPSLQRLPLSNEMWAGYSLPIDRFTAANTRLTLQIEDPELRSAAEMLDAVSRQVDTLGTMVRTGIISSLGGAELDGTRVSDVVAQIERFQVNKARIDLLATGPYADEAAGVDKNPAYQDAVDLLETYVLDGKLDTPKIITAVSRRPTPNLDTVATATTSALRSRATDLRAGAAERQRNFIALAALVLLAGTAFLLLAARSITRPLLSLTHQANDMATAALPNAVKDILDAPLGEDVVIPDLAPVRVTSRDEVQEVATALNVVQRSALDLAVEQAVLRRNIADSFVNLGRRTQNLIGRQLDFITELERNETDPAVLGNLFKLDHLATRARRNAESLVVLAGMVTPRTWTAPIPMTDVIRGALGEVEDYERVDIKGITEATVPGQFAADLVHLLAELLENGLSFSPPGRPVEIYGRMTRNGYVVSVVDQGIGMTDEEFESANDRLAGRESYTVAPSRYLGHYVAGNLARRIGVVARLDESPTGGVVAKIIVPEHILDQAPALPAPGGAQESAAVALSVDETAPSRDEAVTTTGRVEQAETTSNGLRKRVRRSVEAPIPVAAHDPAMVPVDEAGPVVPVDPVDDGEPAPPLEVASVEDALSQPGTLEPDPLDDDHATTVNGLRRRVRGEGLANTEIVHQIHRGTSPVAAFGDAPPQDSAAADDMFALLSEFEAGARRGHDDFDMILAELKAGRGDSESPNGEEPS